MTSKTNDSIAESLEVHESLLPLMPELLQDLWALGCSLSTILDMLARHSLSPSMHVLDLGCGKGAVSISIARQFGCKVDGIDAFEPFIAIAREKALEYQVQQFCQFIRADIRDFCQEKHDYDVVILASLGGILGTWPQTIEQLRNQVHSGGVILIDDGFLKNIDKSSRKGYEHYRPHDQTLKALTCFGDQVIDEQDTSDLSAEINKEYLEKMQKRSNLLIQQHPEFESACKKYIQDQADECDFLDHHVAGTAWLIRKSK
ncbi:methyltransferase domain-containing protein [candidate division KSB1 bacterium]|nr:methyltransferase domain-containing protein [candidate division KSB1 bacterium]